MVVDDLNLELMQRTKAKVRMFDQCDQERYH